MCRNGHDGSPLGRWPASRRTSLLCKYKSDGMDDSQRKFGGTKLWGTETAHNPEPCLIGIHADDGVGSRLAIDIAKLAVAYPSRRRVLVSRFQPLVIHPQAESHLFQQATYSTGADPNLHST